MLLAPFAIKRWGKKKVLIATNLFNVLFLALVYPLMGSIWTVLLCMYFNSIADSFIVVLNPAIQADIRDYQHYKSGERIDGMFGAVAMIGSGDGRYACQEKKSIGTFSTAIALMKRSAHFS